MCSGSGNTGNIYGHFNESETTNHPRPKVPEQPKSLESQSRVFTVNINLHRSGDYLSLTNLDVACNSDEGIQSYRLVGGGAIRYAVTCCKLQ